MTAAGRWRGDGGMTLIELVVTVSILGISFVGLVAGLAAAVQGSAQQRRKAGTEAALRTAVEHLRDSGPTAPQPYIDCAPGYTVSVPGYTVTAQVVGYWDGDPVTNRFTPPAAAPAPPCTADEGLQLIAVEATSENGRVVERTHVVKRR